MSYALRMHWCSSRIDAVLLRQIFILLLASSSVSMPYFNSAKILGLDGSPLTLNQPVSVLAIPSFPNKYLVGAISGDIHLLTVDTDTYKLTKNVVTINVGKDRSVTGVKEDPFIPGTFYASTMTFRWDLKGLGPGGWQNGRVEKILLSSNGESITLGGTIVSGLPVSASLRGVHFPLVDTRTERLLLSVGTFNNGGVASAADNNLPDCLLSASVLEIDIRSTDVTRSLKWSSNDTATATLKESPQQSGILLYATGLRTALQLSQYRNGNVYTMDAGANKINKGPKSVGCNTSATITEKQPSEVINVMRGKFYGHPNRARKQCTFIPVFTDSGEFTQSPGYTPPITTDKDVSATSLEGNAEYIANWFDGKFRGSLISAEIGIDQNNEVNMTDFTPGMYALDFKSLAFQRIANVGGVGVTTDARGSVLAAQVAFNAIGVAIPITRSPKEKHIVIGSVFPVRGLPGSKLFITGYNIPRHPVVKVGGRRCWNIVRKNDRLVVCIVPSIPKHRSKHVNSVSINSVKLRNAFQVLRKPRHQMYGCCY